MSTDPLSGLNTPSVTKFPEIKDIVISDFSEKIVEMREAIDAVAVAADEAAEAMPKVVQCYSCNEYAFDGTLSAYMTDEGEQPFCRDCVSAIERRSKKPAPTLSWGGSSTGWYTTTPHSFTLNFDSSDSYNKLYYGSGVNWTSVGDLDATT